MTTAREPLLASSGFGKAIVGARQVRSNVSFAPNRQTDRVNPDEDELAVMLRLLRLARERLDETVAILDASAADAEILVSLGNGALVNRVIVSRMRLAEAERAFNNAISALREYEEKIFAINSSGFPRLMGWLNREELQELQRNALNAATNASNASSQALNAANELANQVATGRAAIPVPVPEPPTSAPQGTGIFTPRLTKQVEGSVRTGSFGALDEPRKIIIHHTVGNHVQVNIPYHFVIAFDGIVYLGVDTADISGGTGDRDNNRDSIQIAVLGNWDDRRSAISPTNLNEDAMGIEQREALIDLIADCLTSFPSISRTNQFNLPLEHMNRFAMGSRQDAAFNSAYRRHRNPGIKGHEDALNSASRCPGVRLYNWCRDSFVADAIRRAGR